MYSCLTAFITLLLFMFKIILAIVTTIITTTVIAQNIITFRINSLPQYHSAGSDIYLAGSFNGWNPQDTAYRFQKDGQGNYFCELSLAGGNYEFKITRGGWDKVECKKIGGDVSNHSLTVETDTTMNLDVEEWSDRFPVKPKESTASKNVQIIDTAFFIPQLKRTRRIWIYLPENYHQSIGRFPVLYMQDGQNVFDEATSFAGEWNVDEYFDSVYEKGIQTIVVAIDNGGTKRMNEYCPYDMERFGKGEGKEYVDFLVKTLKPFIDKNYRTKKDKAHTSVAGSSMGGLITLYAVLRYPKVFGGAGIFSPALWVAPAIFNDINSKAGKVNSKIYFYVGKQEDEIMVSNTLKAFESMSKISVSKMNCVIRNEGRHSETDWRREFPLFYEWMIKQ
jgi:predicted alpha/beta superfamily hydrolase